jgi:hypothetical protein
MTGSETFTCSCHVHVLVHDRLRPEWTRRFARGGCVISDVAPPSASSFAPIEWPARRAAERDESNVDTGAAMIVNEHDHVHDHVYGRYAATRCA